MGRYQLPARRGRTRLPPDAWLIQALELLYEDDPKPAYVEHNILISPAMLSAQYRPKSPPLCTGGIGPEPIRSTRTAARVEGLQAACRLGSRAGDAHAPAILVAVKRTMPHLLVMQYDADNSFFVDDPGEVAGGMRGYALPGEARWSRSDRPIVAVDFSPRPLASLRPHRSETGGGAKVCL